MEARAELRLEAKREHWAAFRKPDDMNRAERRAAGIRPFRLPRFRSVEDADRWLEGRS